MPTEILIKDEHRAMQAPAPAVPVDEQERGAEARRHAQRVRRLTLNVAAWALGVILFTTLWVVNEWQANGALQSFGHEGDTGQWNPTLWALGVGLWGLIVGIMALRVYFERPPTAAEIEREVERLKPLVPRDLAPADPALRRFVGSAVARVRRMSFHIAAWVLGMVVLTPLWALIEWQDNGRFERFSNDSQPGEWEPWILYVGGIWALVVAILALRLHVDRRKEEADLKARRVLR